MRKLQISLVAVTFWSIGAAAPARAESVLVLAKSDIAGTTEATFGTGATAGGPAVQPLLETLSAAGMQRLDPGSAAIATSTGSASSLLPVGDSAAAQAAAGRGAGLAIVLGVAARSDGPIRGTSLQGAVASFQLRAIDSSGSVRFELKGTDSAYGPDISGAARRAAEKAGRAAATEALRRLRRGSVATASDEVSVTISGAQTFAPLMSIVQRLASTRGVSSIRVLRLAVDQSTVAVRGATPTQIASSLAQVRIAGGSIRPRATGGEVQVAVTESTP